MERFGIYAALLIAIIVGAVFLDQQASNSAYYAGLPTVPCIDATRNIKNSFAFELSIKINGKNYPLDKRIGYDYGQCQHEIFTNDQSGTVYVKQNDSAEFTLGNFFDVWHKTFLDKQIFQYQVDNGKMLKVFVNGKEVKTNYRDIPLTTSEKIEVVFN